MRLLGCILARVLGIEGALSALAGLVFEMIANQGLHHRDESARHREEIVVENADQFQNRVVARHDLPGLDAGDVPLGKTDATDQVSLRPAALLARFLQRTAHHNREAIETKRFDVVFCIIIHD